MQYNSNLNSIDNSRNMSMDYGNHSSSNSVQLQSNLVARANNHSFISGKEFVAESADKPEKVKSHGS